MYNDSKIANRQSQLIGENQFKIYSLTRKSA